MFKYKGGFRIHVVGEFINPPHKNSLISSKDTILISIHKKMLDGKSNSENMFGPL